MSIGQQHIDDAIDEFNSYTEAGWRIPRDVTYTFVRRLYSECDLLTLADVNRRYIGHFDTLDALARALAEQSNPSVNMAPTLNRLGELETRFGPAINWEGWPFRHIDWTAAAYEIEAGIVHGRITVIDDHYFDTVSD